MKNLGDRRAPAFTDKVNPTDMPGAFGKRAEEDEPMQMGTGKGAGCGPKYGCGKGKHGTGCGLKKSAGAGLAKALLGAGLVGTGIYAHKKAKKGVKKSVNIKKKRMRELGL